MPLYTKGGPYNAPVAECCGDLLPMFQHVVESFPRRVEAVMAANGDDVEAIGPLSVGYKCQTLKVQIK